MIPQVLLLNTPEDEVVVGWRRPSSIGLYRPELGVISPSVTGGDKPIFLILDSVEDNETFYFWKLGVKFSLIVFTILSKSHL